MSPDRGGLQWTEIHTRNSEKNHKGKQNEHYVDSWLGCGLLCMCVDGEYNSCEGERERERGGGGGGWDRDVSFWVCMLRENRFSLS